MFFNWIFSPRSFAFLVTLKKCEISSYFSHRLSLSLACFLIFSRGSQLNHHPIHSISSLGTVLVMKYENFSLTFSLSFHAIFLSIFSLSLSFPLSHSLANWFKLKSSHFLHHAITQNVSLELDEDIYRKSLARVLSWKSNLWRKSK